MKIRLSQLRSIIKEEVSRILSEVPLEDITPVIDARDDKSDEKLYTGVKKFHKTDQYKAKAEAAFRTWPFPVYIIPVVGRNKSYNRTTIYEADEGIEILRRLNLNYDLEDLTKKLAEGGTVFLNSSTVLAKGQLPTPWMMIHALFDETGSGNGPFTRMAQEVFDLVEKTSAPDADGKSISSANLVRRMTMGSARNAFEKKNPSDEDKTILQSDSDIAAELATQAVITTSGVRFITDDGDEWKNRNRHADSKGANPPLERTSAKLRKLKADIDALNLKERVFNLLRGKVVWINTGGL